MSDTWEVRAIRYAEMTERKREQNFILDDHSQDNQPIDFFIWVIENATRRIVVDTGFDHAEAGRRNRPVLRTPGQALAACGIDAAAVNTVILTHLHFDHAGSLAEFPNAHLWVQEAEMAYATGPCMCADALRAPFTGDHVCDMVRALFDGRVEFVTGSAEVAPGVEVHLIGGHTRGLQAVRVRTRRGWVVLASDAAHYYENFLAAKPFPLVVDVEDMIRGFATIQRLADSPDHVIPGHDPLVRRLYPQAGSTEVVALHADPVAGIIDAKGRAL